MDFCFCCSLDFHGLFVGGGCLSSLPRFRIRTIEQQGNTEMMEILTNHPPSNDRDLDAESPIAWLLRSMLIFGGLVTTGALWSLPRLAREYVRKSLVHCHAVSVSFVSPIRLVWLRTWLEARLFQQGQ